MFDMHVLYDSRDVAAYIAQQCLAMRYSFNNTKIQKLLYCVYGTVLGRFNARITDEHPKAWPYGPVFPKVFDYIHNGKLIELYSRLLEHELADEEKAFVCGIVRYFGKFAAGQLSYWSPRPESPWYKVVAVEGSGWNVVVRDQDIRDYFRESVLVKQ